MTCEDCLHNYVCSNEILNWPSGYKEGVEKDCGFFEDKNLYIKLPVELNQTVYVNTCEYDYKTCDIETVKCYVKHIRLKSDGKTVMFTCSGYYKSGYPYNGTFTEKSIGKKVFMNEQDAIVI